MCFWGDEILKSSNMVKRMKHKYSDSTSIISNKVVKGSSAECTDVPANSDENE